MLRLVHISDLHFYETIRVAPMRLLNKRMTGYLNLVLHRQFQISRKILDVLMDTIRSLRPDHLVVTGDISNLSLGSEFAGIRGLLLASGLSADAISVVPGNHDRYTLGSERGQRFEGYLMPFISSDIPDCPAAFPFIRLRDEVAIIGINTSLSLPLLFAGGRIGIEQLTRLEILLDHPKLKGRFRVFLLHHPPYLHPIRRLHAIEGLADYRGFLAVASGQPGLALHGHLHRNLMRKVETPGGTLLIAGVSSSSFEYPGANGSNRSSFTLYELGREGVLSMKSYRLSKAGMAYEPEELQAEIFLPAAV